MIYQIEFDTDALKTIATWKKSAPLKYKKLRAVLMDIVNHPREGIGHPEPLKSGNGSLYSRRITANDRIIYDILDDVVLVMVISIGGHYKDK